MTTTIKLDEKSLAVVIGNLHQVNEAVARKHLIIGLNAAGSPAKATAQARVARETGMLRKSLIIKVPRDKHTRIPTGVLIGPSRDAVRAFIVRKSKTSLLTDRKATKRVLSGGRVRVRKPSRYAHLAEKKSPAIAAASRTLETAGVARLVQKVQQGIASEPLRK